MTAPAGQQQIQCCGVWTDYPVPDCTTQCPVCGTVFTVKTTLTRKRPPRVVENDEYAAFLRRVIRAFGHRIAAGDIDALTDAAFLSGQLDTVIKAAVTGLRDRGYSWADIGRQLGVTRQAAQQRFGGDTP
jgi:hypothetical protein